MRDLLVRAVHLLVTAVKLLRPGGVRAVAAESVLLKHQLRVSNRSRQRAPNLTSFDRIVLGLATLLVNPRRIPKIAAILKPATLFSFHKALVERKYRLLFSSSAHRRKPAPKAHRWSSSRRSSRSRGAIPGSDTCASPSRSLVPSGSTSTRM